ncbi:hypothetical protein FACS1894166_08840 [Bacilli bacterium]|nr:hypothetical protein FACS1894166_08840 [Bacilli bacterium]
MGLGFRSIIAADLLGESPDFNPVEQDIGLNTYFYNGKNLGINIDVDKMKQPGVSQSVIDQGNDAIDAAYVKLLSYIKMSLERQL